MYTLEFLRAVWELIGCDIAIVEQVVSTYSRFEAAVEHSRQRFRNDLPLLRSLTNASAEGVDFFRSESVTGDLRTVSQRTYSIH